MRTVGGLAAGIAGVVVACGGDAQTGPVERIEARVTWEASFPDGSTCSFTRHYTGREDRSAPWLCPECTTVWRADVSLDGLTCYARLTDAPPPEVEWLGTDGTRWFRSSHVHGRLLPHGTASRTGDAVRLAHALVVEAADGAVRLSVTGGGVLGDAVGDPMHNWGSPSAYLCGWPSAQPPAYAGDWSLEVGEMLPDGWFLDQCGQPLRMHDLEGRYLVVDISASDCPPCQRMAATEPAFVEAMRREGLDVEVVTLLAPSLGAVLTPTPITMLSDWAEYFRLDAPVVGDRGWGLVVAAGALGDAFAYPTSIVVAPDLTVLDVSVGFDTWDRQAGVIRGDAR